MCSLPNPVLAWRRVCQTHAEQLLSCPPAAQAAAAPLELSLVLCDDAHIRELNAQWRGIDAPTDVLSFEMEQDGGLEDGEGGMPEVGAAAGAMGSAHARGWRCCVQVVQHMSKSRVSRLFQHASWHGLEDTTLLLVPPRLPPVLGTVNAAWRCPLAPRCPFHFRLLVITHAPHRRAAARTSPPLQLPVNVLGDVVISLDTAARQAAERRYGLLDEARVLLVHGVLHLLGYDHEEGEARQAQARRRGGLRCQSPALACNSVAGQAPAHAR